MKAASLVAAALVCAAFSAGPVAAQLGPGPGVVRSDTRGLGIGVQFNGTGVSSDGDGFRTVSGAGMGLTLSYGMSDALSVFGRGSYGYRTTQLDLGARYRFGGASGALRPYVEGAVTRLGTVRPPDPRALSQTSFNAEGLGMTVGAGVEYFISPRLAVDLGLSHTRGRFSDGTIVGEGSGVVEKFRSNRVQVGVTWRP